MGGTQWLSSEDSSVVHVLSLCISLPALCTAGADTGSSRLDCDRGQSSSIVISAIILQHAGAYRLLYNVPGVCSMAAALRRQLLLRPNTYGWITQRDLSMWLKAVDAVAFGTEAEV